MAEVVVTLKLAAGEFQTLREELRAHSAELRAGAKAAKAATNLRDERALLQRHGRVEFLLEKLG